MPYEVIQRPAVQRAVEKSLSRELDAHFLEESLASREELSIRNDFFAALDLGGFEISAIGKRPLPKRE